MIILLIGLLAGFLSGLLGIGGGSVIVPALVLWAGLKQQSAQGIALLVFVPTAALGAYAYYRYQSLDLKMAGYIIIGGLMGVLGGSLLAHFIPHLILTKIFGIFAIILGGRMLIPWKKD